MGGAARVGGVGGAGGEGVDEGAQRVVGAGAVFGDQGCAGGADGVRDGVGAAGREGAGAVLGAGGEGVEDDVEQGAEGAGAVGAACEGGPGRGLGHQCGLLRGEFGRRSAGDQGRPKLLSPHGAQARVAAPPLVRAVVPPFCVTGRQAGVRGRRVPVRRPRWCQAPRTVNALRRSSSWSMSLRRRAGGGLPSARQVSPRRRVVVVMWVVGKA